MARILSRRTSQTLLAVLSLFLLGTIMFLWAVRSYFSIDAGAIVRPEELGTWDEIKMGIYDSGSAARTSWQPTEFDDAIAKSAADAAKAAGFGEDKMGFIPTGRNNTPKAWDPVNDPPEKIPRIIHQTWKDKTLPPNWQAVRDECAHMHPDYEYMLWTDADSRKFIVDHYSWFLPIFDAYPYAIQRADAIRYFILHYYGGIYMDLDVGCLRRFDPLLRFEVVLPKTIPVGVSNDVMASAKGHPFMDHLIHNLVTFNHRYLTHYPTVMFSTGPMFVSASYGLFVDVHGLAAPSTPTNPTAGFHGIRVLPKALYGKNAKPSEAPDAFFRHFYGSSWHAGDAGFLIFLREHGRFLIFIGFLVVMYGVLRSFAPRLLMSLSGDRFDRSGRRSSRRRGHWITLPFIRDPRSGQYRSLPREIYAGPESANPKHFYDEATQTGVSLNSANDATEILPLAERGHQPRVAAPRPQRMPLFELGEGENSNGEDDLDLGPGLNAERMKGGADNNSGGIFGWMNMQQQNQAASSSSRSPSSASIGMSSEYSSPMSGAADSLGRSGSMSKFKDRANGILYLPAFLVGGGSSASSTDSNLASVQTLDDESSTGTPSSSLAAPWKLTQAHSRNSSNIGGGGSFGNWAASFLNRSSDSGEGGSGNARRQHGSSREDDEEPSTLQKMWGGVSLSARTPSPSMFLNATLGRRSDERKTRADIESTGRPEQQSASDMARSVSSGSFVANILSNEARAGVRRTASTNQVPGASARAFVGPHSREGSDGEVIIPLDDVPPPYEQGSRSANVLDDDQTPTMGPRRFVGRQ